MNISTGASSETYKNYTVSQICGYVSIIIRHKKLAIKCLLYIRGPSPLRLPGEMAFCGFDCI
jgi:hypothetical protein